MFDNYTGTIVVSNPLNKEQISQYNLTIQATDEGYKLNGGSSLSSYVRYLFVCLFVLQIVTQNSVVSACMVLQTRFQM